jgi:hypothetical protein
MSSMQPAQSESLARTLSERMRTTNRGVATAEWRALRESLTGAQLQRIRAKQAYEACSFLAVLRDWPSLFEEASDG